MSKKEYIVDYFGFKQPDEFGITRKEIDGGRAAEIELLIEKIPQFSSGSKMFLNPRIYSLFPYKLPKSDNRRQDFSFQGLSKNRIQRYIIYPQDLFLMYYRIQRKN